MIAGACMLLGYAIGRKKTPARVKTCTAKAAFGGTAETAGIGDGDVVETDPAIQPET